jgi:hypothetical protein
VNDIVRVWRVRKNHTWIDARVRAAAGHDGVELELFYDGSLVLARRCPDREAARATADVFLENLQRAGWNTHW